MLLRTQNHLYDLLIPLIHTYVHTQDACCLVDKLSKALNAEIKYKCSFLAEDVS